jgi:DNA-directed RNA polymerase beta subunit
MVTAPINSSLRLFTNPLSQMMDQTNALAELTHKRRLSCLGPVVVKERLQNMAISWNSCNSLWSNLSHWDTGRKNAGLVNSNNAFIWSLLKIQHVINSTTFLRQMQSLNTWIVRNEGH